MYLENWRGQGRRSTLQMPQPGGAAHAAGVSVFRWKNRRVRFLAENVVLQASGNILVKSRNLGSATAQYDYIGIEKINHLCQTPRQPVFESLHPRKRRRLTGSASRADLRAL